MAIPIKPTDALVVVDVQHDFLPGGALAVREGERIFAPINALMPRFRRVYATRDWHPADHSSFAPQGGPWPVHCVAHTHGSALDERLDVREIDRVVDKGVDRATDGYSGFAATDLAEGLDVVVVRDATAAVNIDPADEARALDELRASGVHVVESSEI